MLACLHLILIIILALFLPKRLGLLRNFEGLPGYLLSLGLALFLINWGNLLLYFTLGWGTTYTLLSTLWLAGAVWYASRPTLRDGWTPPWSTRLSYGFTVLAALVLARFIPGVVSSANGNIWVNFNFLDTAIHLSVAQAFAQGSGFPPIDLDMYPYPLKYHFVADFMLAHLNRLGLPLLSALVTMNIISACAMVGALWSCLERWLRLPTHWILLAATLFLFLHNGLFNLLNHYVLGTGGYNARDLLDGIIRYPYFNFELTIYNLLEPQRSLLFSLPAILLVLHAAFGPSGSRAKPFERLPEEHRTGLAFVLVCLMPLAHIVSFAVLACCLLPRVVSRRWLFLGKYRALWLVALGLGLLQLGYLFFYGPEMHPGFSAWFPKLPFDHAKNIPLLLQRPLFWLLVNGDFLFWGLLLGTAAWFSRVKGPGGDTQESPTRHLIRHWGWYFLVCLGFFLLINVYRYSQAWGDSNKFVFFLNLGLTLVIVKGLADWSRDRRWKVTAALVFFFTLCLVPCVWVYGRMLTAPGWKILIFCNDDVKAAAWLEANTKPDCLVLTSAFGDHHSVSSLAGRPVPAGIYADSSPYLQDDRKEKIRRVFEQADLVAAEELKVKLIWLSRHERRVYKLNPKWSEWMKTGTAVVYNSSGYENYESVYVFDLRKLSESTRLSESR